MSVLLLTLCVTIATNLTNGLLINYTQIGSAFNKLSENIYFYILTLTIMAVVFDLLRAIAEYWFRIKNGISWGTFWFQIEEYETVNVKIKLVNTSEECDKRLKNAIRGWICVAFVDSSLKWWVISVRVSPEIFVITKQTALIQMVLSGAFLIVNIPRIYSW